MGIEDIFNEPMAPIVEEITPAPEPEVLTPEPQQQEPIPEPAPQLEAPKEDEPKHVPLATFLDQRDEAKRWKQEAEQLRAAQAKPQPQAAPDPFDDPDGFAAAQDAKMHDALWRQKMQTSEIIARQQHGAEVLEAAGQWAADKVQRDPLFQAAFLQQNHPMDWIVQQHKRDAFLSDVGDNVDDWFTKEAVKRGYAPAPTVAAPAAPAAPAPVPAPPRSLASAPGHGGGVQAVPTGPGSALASVFTR